jgi:site-specific recombinase XerD
MGQLIRPPVVRQKPPVTLTPAEVDALRRQCATMRDRVVIELAYGMGLRVMEIAALRVDDIDWSRMILLVRGKGGTEELLPMPVSVAWAIRAYFTQHPPPGSGHVVRQMYSDLPMAADSLSKHVINLARRAGVKRGAHDGRGAHSLRRTCATELLESGASVVQVQQVLRHRNLATTQHYLRRSSAEELRRVLERRATA